MRAGTVFHLSAIPGMSLYMYDIIVTITMSGSVGPLSIPVLCLVVQSF